MNTTTKKTTAPTRVAEACLVLGTAACFLTSALCREAAAHTTGSNSPPAALRYRITESYRFFSRDQNAAVRLAVMVPKTRPYQHVSTPAVSWEGTCTPEQKTGVDVIKLEGRIPAGRTKGATVSFEVTMPIGPALWEAPVEALQLHSQTNIESDDLVLAQKASELVKDRNRESVERVFEFVAGYLSWPRGERINERLSALKAFRTRVAGCSEFANLMVALWRAAGIPAQSISGLALPPARPPRTETRTWSHPAGAHAWVEFHTSAGWEFTDPSWASMAPSSRTLFGRTDGLHLSYGEVAAHDRTHSEITAWAEAQGPLVGAMSAPGRFAAAASVPGVSFTPTVCVETGLNSPR